MAIKVNGTTVIDDSRNLVNIASGAGSSTTAGDVGTYTWGRPKTNTSYAIGDTASGVFGASFATSSVNYYTNETNQFDYNGADYVAQTAFSGTWRAMNPSAGTSTRGSISLWVRIS